MKTRSIKLQHSIQTGELSRVRQFNVFKSSHIIIYYCSWVRYTTDKDACEKQIKKIFVNPYGRTNNMHTYDL